MNILMIIHPAVGPVYSVLYLARLLSNRKHELWFLVPDDISVIPAIIEQQGFKVCLYRKAEVNQLFVEQLIKTNRINGVILDADQLDFALLFYGVKIGKLFINNCVQSDKETFVPPFYSDIIPRSNLFSYLRVEMIWLRRIAHNRWSYFKSGFFRNKDDLYRRSIAKSIGFPLGKLAKFDRAWLYRLPIYPELFLYPSEFDFPGRKFQKNQFFIGPMVDTIRKEEKFEWEVIRGANPIVFCALGTLAHTYYAEYLSFLEKIILVFAKMTEFNLILAIGVHSDSERFRRFKGSNIYIYRTAPQLQILQRTSLMITHGGLNSIKECIYFGVPMLVYPLNPYSDQRGNGARVAFHQIGKVGNVGKDSIEKIETDCKEIIFNRSYYDNVRKMQQSFLNYREKQDSTVEGIERLLSS